MTPEEERRKDEFSLAASLETGSGLLVVAGAADYLGVTQAFVRRLVLERRVRYFKLGKFVRFRSVDLDAFVEAGRQEPVAPWVHTRSTARRASWRCREVGYRLSEAENAEIWDPLERGTRCAASAQ